MAIWSSVDPLPTYQNGRIRDILAGKGIDHSRKKAGPIQGGFSHHSKRVHDGAVHFCYRRWLLESGHVKELCSEFIAFSC